MCDPEMRKDCPMRGNPGNCSPVGGFCVDAVSDEICEAVHNMVNAIKTAERIMYSTLIRSEWGKGE